MPNEAIKQGITAAGFVPVRLPANQVCNALSLWTEDGAKWIYSHNAAGDTAIEITVDGTSGFPLSLSEVLSRADSAGAIICYAKGSSSTNLVGLITKL